MSVLCRSCKEYTPIEAPIITKLSKSKFIIDGICSKCKKSVNKSLNRKQRKLLPGSVLNADDYSRHSDYKTTEGGLFPIAAIIPAILSALGAFAKVAAPVAAASVAAKNLIIDPLLENKKIETNKELIKGSGLDETPSSRTLNDIVTNIDSLTDHEKRQLIQTFQGMGYIFI